MINIINRFAFAVLSFGVFFSGILSFWGLGFVNMLDELMMLIASMMIGYIIIIKGKIKRLYLFLLISQVLFLIFSLFGSHFNFVNSVIQNFIHIKFFLLFIFVKWISRNRNDFLIKLMHGLFYLTLVGVAVNLVAGERFNLFFDAEVLYRFESFARVIGFQLQSNFLAYFLAVFYIYKTLLMPWNISVYKFIGLTFFFIALIVLAGSKTILLVFPIVIYLYLTARFNNKFLNFTIVASLVLIGLLTLLNFGGGMLSDINKISAAYQDIDNTLYIRAIMMYYGVVLALNYFPIGAGSATFGSVMSANSKVYEELGLSQLHFFSDMQGVYDSNLASIMGEFGFLGVTIFLFLIYEVYKSVTDTQPDHDTGYYKAIIIFALLVAAVAPVFVHGYTSLIFALAFNIKKYDKPVIVWKKQ